MITFTAENSYCRSKPPTVRIAHGKIFFSQDAVILLDLKQFERICFRIHEEDEVIYFYKDDSGLPISRGTGKIRRGLTIHSRYLVGELLKHINSTGITITITDEQTTLLDINKKAWFLLKKKAKKIAA